MANAVRREMSGAGNPRSMLLCKCLALAAHARKLKRTAGFLALIVGLLFTPALAGDVEWVYDTSARHVEDPATSPSTPLALDADAAGREISPAAAVDAWARASLLSNGISLLWDPAGLMLFIR